MPMQGASPSNGIANAYRQVPDKTDSRSAVTC